jgi:hypothetical protein
MPDAAFLVVAGHVVAAVVLGTIYFRRFRIARPAIGVITFGDVAAMLVGIVLVPYLYQLISRCLVAGLLGLAAISILNTDDLFNRVWGLPFAPLIAWPVGVGQWLSVGLGDVLLATLFPLVMRKAFGRSAAVTSLALGIGALVILLLLLDLGVVRVTIPAMVVLGPLIVLHYLFWRRRARERTTWRYWAAEPASSLRLR